MSDDRTDPAMPTPVRGPGPSAADGAVMTRSGAAPPVGRRVEPPALDKQPFTDPPAERPADPEAGVDTTELSLAELQAMARRAMGVAAEPEPGGGDPATGAVDLVAEEEAEQAEEAAGADESEREPSGTGPIDPRIRDRRVAVTRAEGRRRLRILLTAISIASAIGIVWLAVQSPLLAVRTVDVEGAARESHQGVIAAADVRTGSPLLSVDTAAVARRVEALPWVAKAEVDRDLPNRLTIRVIERSPTAFVRRPGPRGADGTLGPVVLVDRFGRVLGDVAAPPPGLPELVGIITVPERGKHIRPAGSAAAIAELPDALRAQTASLVRRGGGARLKLVAVPGAPAPAAGEIRLGSLDDVAAKGAAALAVLDQLTAGGEEVAYIDVRVPLAPATG